MRPTVSINWRLLTCLAATLVVWVLLTDGAFRLSHGGRSGLRHAVYAQAVKVVRTVRLAITSV